VSVGAVDESGSPQGLIVTDDEEIQIWADEVVDGYLAAAEQLTPRAITTGAVAADGGT
jgi:hypothetical protein